MNEKYAFKRSWFGTYKIANVQAYLDDLYIEVEQTFGDMTREMKELQQENEILRQYITEDSFLRDQVVLPDVRTFNEDDWTMLPLGYFKITDNGSLLSKDVDPDHKDKSLMTLLTKGDNQQVEDGFLENKSESSTITSVEETLPSGQSLDKSHAQVLTEPAPIANHQATTTADSQIASQLAAKDTTIDSLQAEITALKQQVAYLDGQADFANDLLRDVYKS
ncbi:MULTISPECIES: hypothetical protein [Aerococcus]|uniref:hypothetical protein n=1 Tax=Aerococcus TaxID=1375 RepID=UPI003D6BCAA5